MTSLLGTVEAALENECNHLNRHFAVILMIKHPELFKQKSFFEREMALSVLWFIQTELLLILVGLRNLTIDVYKYLML